VDADLRLLRYFLAVAEELNFTRAAARLHMAQQPLSAAIARFERDLGAELFVRTTRHVELTDAGRALVEPARAALQAAEDALSAARSAGAGATGELQIGLSQGAHYGLEPLFDAVQAQYPRLRLRMRQQSSEPLIESLRAGQLDLAIGFCVTACREIKAQRLKDEPVLVAVGERHRLAARASVHIRELSSETFALDDPRDGAGYNDAVLALCARNGLTPRTSDAVGQRDVWEHAILNDGCVGLTAASAVQAAHREICLLDLKPAATFPLDLLSRSVADAPPRPAVRAMLALAATVASRHHWTAASD
jgi:DNA-binding transcriptional LysR family regulator